MVRVVGSERRMKMKRMEIMEEDGDGWKSMEMDEEDGDEWVKVKVRVSVRF